MSREEMLTLADWAGVGAVESARSEWRGRSLWTFVELSVIETKMGEDRPSVTVIVPGGFDLEQGVAMQVPGVPLLFPRGARMLVFGRDSELSATGISPVSLLSGIQMQPSEADGLLRDPLGMRPERSPAARQTR